MVVFEIGSIGSIHMMSGVLGDIKQQFGSLGKQLGQTIASAPKTAVKTVASQVGIEIKEGQQKPPQERVEKAKKENADFVKELYGAEPNQKPPEQPKENTAAIEQQKAAQKMAEENPDKSPEDIQKMMSLRQHLHGEYYQQLITKKGRPEEVQEEHEREAERMERLGMEDLQEKKKEDEKKKPISVLQQERKTEAPMGAG